MKFHVLIIEDDDEFANVLSEQIAAICPLSTIQVAKNKSSAIELLKSSFYDIVLLDLKIPSDCDLQDEDPKHGHAVFTYARAQLPGTPFIVITGSPAEEFIPSLLENSGVSDIWGAGKEIPVVSFVKKYRLNTFPDVFKSYCIPFSKLNDVELIRNGVSLDDPEERLVRIFASSCGCTKATFCLVGGGLSGSKVLKVTVSNSSGQVVHNAVCKLGDMVDIKDESFRYSTHVARLPPGATPRKLAVLNHGAKSKAGVFYGLAEDCDLNAFECMPPDHDPAKMIEALMSNMRCWVEAGERRMPVKELRRLLLSDEKFEDFSHLFPWSKTIEEQEIQVKWGCSHGDLHGFNILISAKGTPFLIDYGDAGHSTPGIDPITLELSILFHPSSPLKDHDWPSADEALHWGDLAKYLIECPYPEFVKACRSWATQVTAGHRELAAIAYSYLMRQFKYEGINKERCLALLEGVRSFYEST